jgi:hypothetical protein
MRIICSQASFNYPEKGVVGWVDEVNPTSPIAVLKGENEE